MPTKKQYREALKLTKGCYAEAGKLLGVSRQAVFDYVQRYPDLKKMVEGFQEIMLDYVEKSIFDRVMENDLEGIRLAAKYYGHKRGLIERKELTGKDGEPLLSHQTQIDAKIAVLLHNPEVQKVLEVLDGIKELSIQGPADKEAESDNP
ncbi:MAG: hypothetical protein JRJ29_11615 [Deltaproteobacteria bacterium]|nr:hypothetical protein [Deltaproteobacteria bacterium]